MERGNGKTGEGNEVWAGVLDDGFGDLDEPDELDGSVDVTENDTEEMRERSAKILLTRGERMRSMKEAETLRAIEVLDKAGLFIPMDGLELYHGRYRGGLEQVGKWEVEPDFDNAGNATNNRNINKVAGLNTTDERTAGRFAQARANIRNREVLEETGELNDATRAIPEIHRIKCEDSDAQIIDADFSLPKDAKMREEIQAALDTLTGSIEDKIVVGDDEREFGRGLSKMEVMRRRREKTERVKAILGSYETGRTYDQGEVAARAESIAGGSRVEALREEVVEVMKATNTMNLLKTHPQKLMVAYMEGDKVDSMGRPVGMVARIPAYDAQTGAPYTKEVPFSGSFLREWMKQAHVIGMKVDVASATLTRELMKKGMDRQEIKRQGMADVSNYVLFDMSGVRKGESIEERREKIEREYGATTRALGAIFQEDAAHGKHARVKEAEPGVKRELMDIYGKSEDLVRAATESGATHGGNFRRSAGNWEGYSLGEHTETVLDYFDEVWADEVPSEMIPVMKLAILVHDLGKPEAAARGDKRNQKAWNVDRAERFMDEIGVEPGMSELIVGMIGEAQEWTTKAFIRAEEKRPEELKVAEAGLRRCCKKIMEEYLEREATKEEIEGMEKMCVILQTCDSGAYTSRAMTRTASGVRMRNAGAFNSSFNGQGKLRAAE